MELLSQDLLEYFWKQLSMKTAFQNSIMSAWEISVMQFLTVFHRQHWLKKPTDTIF